MKKKRHTCKSVSKWTHGEATEWVFVVPAEIVTAYLRRTSKNPNSQGRRLLAELGMYKPAPRRKKGRTK